jgi:hypothetical protein
MRASRLTQVALALGAIASHAGVAAAAVPDPVRTAAEAVSALRGRLEGRRTATASRHYVSLDPDHAALLLEFRDAPSLEVALEDGRVLVDGRSVGRYEPSGELELSWREFLADADHLDVVETVRLLRGWEPRSGGDAHAVRAVRRSTRSVQAPAVSPPAPQPVPPAAAGGPSVDLSSLTDRLALEDRLRALLREAPAGALRVTVAGGEARMGDFSVGSSETHEGHLLVLRGTADIYGRLVGNLVTVDGDVVLHRGAVVQGDVLAIGGRVRDGGGTVSGEIASLAEAAVPAAPRAAAGGATRTLYRSAGLVGVFLTLAFLGLALVLFGRPQLEVVSDTVSHSFGRAFVTGLVAQALVVPTFGMLVVGLALSIVGVLLIPFVVIAYALLVVVGLLGGLLAVAHAMGETWTRRRLASGADIGSPNSYRYLLVGLAGAGAVWATWVAVGWVPVAGDLVRAAAILVTWLLGTAGFGAMLLSRAGIRENFAGRLIPAEALTDEYLWATPQFGVPAVKRPGPRRERGE